MSPKYGNYCGEETNGMTGNMIFGYNDGLMDLFAYGKFMDCWIIGFEFKKDHKCWILRRITE